MLENSYKSTAKLIEIALPQKLKAYNVEKNGRWILPPRCRVCRTGVVQDGHLLQSSCSDQVCDSNSLWYVKDDNMPEWIYEAVSKVYDIVAVSFIGEGNRNIQRKPRPAASH